MGMILILIGCQGAPKSTVGTSNIPDPTQQNYLNSFNQVRSTAHVCKDNIATASNDGGSYGPSAPLHWNSLLASAALAHAQDVYNNNLTASNPHVGSDGSTVGPRVNRANYDYLEVGENIAWDLTPNSINTALEAWLASDSGHCQALMNGKYIDLGLAEYNGIWVMVAALSK